MDTPIDTLVPHRGEMSLLNEVLEWDEQSLQANVLPDQHAIFATENGVPVSVGIEYMAQGIAAHAGHLALDQGKPIKIGFLLGTRKFTSDFAFFPKGEPVLVKVTRVIMAEDENPLGVYACELITTAGSAKASLNVYLPVDAQQFIDQERAARKA